MMKKLFLLVTCLFVVAYAGGNEQSKLSEELKSNAVTAYFMLLMNPVSIKKVYGKNVFYATKEHSDAVKRWKKMTENFSPKEIAEVRSDAIDWYSKGF